MPNDSASRYGPAEDPGYEGFHTYATSDLYDTNGGDERWPDNWAAPQSAVPYQGQPYEDDEDEYDDEDEEATKRDYWSALLWASGWYAVPIIILVLRAVFLSSDPDPVCAAAGLGACTSPRADAMATLISNAPLWCFALVGALTLALVLRWASDSWRAATIGFCAAVVSGGAVTVLYGIL